jgi:transposase-like protein
MPKLRRAATYSTRRRWTSADARDALLDLEASGLSLAAFAKREGLVAERLYRWRRRFAAGRTKSAAAPAFVEVRPRTPSVVEIVLRSGRTLRVPESLESRALLRLVEVLDPPC